MSRMVDELWFRTGSQPGFLLPLPDFNEVALLSNLACTFKTASMVEFCCQVANDGGSGRITVRNSSCSLVVWSNFAYILRKKYEPAAMHAMLLRGGRRILCLASLFFCAVALGKAMNQWMWTGTRS